MIQPTPVRATVRQGNIDGEPNIPGHGDTERNRRSSGSECKQDDPVEVREPGEFRADRARRRLGRRLGGETTEGRRNGRPLPGELAQSACRRFHLAFELCVPAAQLTVQAARPQVVADTQDTSSASNGFVRKSVAPLMSARVLASRSTSAVRTRTGRKSSGAIVLEIAVSTPKPSR